MKKVDISQIAKSHWNSGYAQGREDGRNATIAALRKNHALVDEKGQVYRVIVEDVVHNQLVIAPVSTDTWQTYDSETEADVYVGGSK